MILEQFLVFQIVWFWSRLRNIGRPWDANKQGYHLKDEFSLLAQNFVGRALQCSQNSVIRNKGVA